MHNRSSKTQHLFPAHSTQVRMPNATVPVLATSNTHLLEWLHSIWHTRRTTESQWNYSVMLGDNWWRRLPLCCREELTEVEQVGLTWQAQVTPTEHVGTEVSGLPFHWRPPAASSEGSTAHRQKENIEDRTDTGPNRNTSPSSTAGFGYLFCLLSSSPLVGEKSPGQLCFWFFVTIFLFFIFLLLAFLSEMLSALTVHQHSTLGNWALHISAVNNPFIFSFRAVLHCNKAFFCSLHFLKFAESS